MHIKNLERDVENKCGKCGYESRGMAGMAGMADIVMTKIAGTTKEAI